MSTDSRYILASKLAQFLRRNGDKVINGSCKLSLTTSALCLLNSLFIDYLNPDVQRIEVYDYDLCRMLEDVQYLYDFMKRTSSLKLFHRTQTLRGGVDLSHFSNLIVLELRKIPAHLIIGLNSLSIQLKALICSRSIYLLKELFGYSGDDQNSGVWKELKELNLSFNYLENLDDSIKNLPNIEILDLSHNNIRNTEELKALNYLNIVNLSYNQIENLPHFNSLCCRFLNKLYVRYNNLEKLEGLECLFNLEDFDVGYNLLSEYSVLAPLDKLKSLKMLNLEGNPIYFNKRHVKLVSTFIHPYALNRGLYLNGKILCIPQSTGFNIGDSEEISSRHQTSINTVVGDMQDTLQPPHIKPLSECLSPLISVSPERSLDGVSISSYTSQGGAEKIETVVKVEKVQPKKTKAGKFREVFITEPSEDENENTSLSLKEPEIPVPSHIKTKLAFEARRKERGDAWLIPDNAFQKLYPPKVPSNTPVSTNAIEKIQEELPQKLQDCLESQIQGNNSPCEKEMTAVLEIGLENTSDSGSERKRHISKESDDIEVLISTSPENDIESERKVISSENFSDSDFYKSAEIRYSNGVNEDIDDLLDSDEETEDSIFFVERYDSIQHTLSINIGPNYIKEKDTITGKVLDKLDLSTLSSVKSVTHEKDGSESFEIVLEFDTVKASRQKRIYVCHDFESAQNLSKILQPFADANTLKEAVVGALECLNCKSQFSKQVAHRKVVKTKKPFMGKNVMSSSYDASKGYIHEVYACPNCGNDILVELENMPLPANATSSSYINKIKSTKKSSNNTPDNLSVGSQSSGNFFSNFLSSIKISPMVSPMVKRKSATSPSNDNQGEDSSKSVHPVVVCQNGKDIPKRKESDSQMTRNSSDITIISNPSQSSIAIIPEPGMDTNLNTIVEKESQLSLSPPFSRDSAPLSNGTASQNFKGSQIFQPGNDIGITENICASPKEDHDFYSFTESCEGVKDKALENVSQNFQPLKSSDIISCDSDVYHSPFKSIGTSKSENACEIEPDESLKLMQILSDRKMVTYDSFTQLDHRLKLHIEINIFKNDEHLVACLQTSIVPLSTGEEFNGLFMLSSRNVYILKFLPEYALRLEQHDSLEKQVQIVYNGPIVQVKQIKTILGSQGISIACGPPTHVYTLVIRDVDTCNSFCNLISEQILEQNQHFECLASTEEMLDLLYESVLTSFTESQDKPEILLHQFTFHKLKDLTFPVCIIITHEDIFLSNILFKKQQSCADLSKMQAYCYTSTEHQKISDVISLKLKKDFTTVEVCFMIESSEIDCVSWVLQMQSKSALFTFVSALKNPWEELFAVSLPLTMEYEST